MATGAKKNAGHVSPATGHDAAHRDTKGPLDARERHHATYVETRGPAISRQHRAPRGARSARPQDTPRRGAHGPSRSDRVPLDRPRQDVEGSDHASRVQAGRHAQRRPHVLAHAGPRFPARTSGTPALRRRGSFARPTAARPGRASTASTSIRAARTGAAATRTARRTGPSCIRSSSTRATRSTCTSGCPAAASSNRTTPGADWHPLNAGVRADFMPDPYPEYGHDPHCMRMHPLAPDRLYHQNHCGIYRLDRPATRWTEIGVTMPKSVGSIGLPMVLHPRDPDTLWVFPMDGTSVWPRVSPGASPLPTARSTAESPGSARRQGFRRRRPGGRSSARR